MKRLAMLLVCLAVLTAAAQPQGALNLVRTIALPDVEGRIDHLSLDAKGQRLFVAALGNNSVEVLDLKTAKRIRSLGHFSEPQGLIYLAGQDQLLVANGGSGTVSSLDTASFGVTKHLDGMADADNVRYDAQSGLVYVGYGNGALGVIRSATMERVESIKLGGHPESFQLEQPGNRIFVNVPGARSIAVIDRAKHAVVTSWPLASARSNFPMALDEPHHRLFVGCRSPARLLVLDTVNGRTVAEVEISGDPDDVFLDAKRQRLYVSCGAGFLDVIQRRAQDGYERIARQPTRDGARTSLYSPDLDRLFLAVPKRSSREAEIRVYQPE